ncbi:MAG: DUF4917 family protein [Acetobacter orientalis]|uniref:DUF4917 family protein n=1 Tax=Acetobacter orientalis TaxID=146474 RepID=UPI0039E889AC
MQKEFFRINSWLDIATRYNGGKLVLGNGASMAISQSFGYQSLLEQSSQDASLLEDVRRLFDFFKTTDFELILRLVWQASNVNRALSIPDERTHQAYINVREALITAVGRVHPNYEAVSPYIPRMYQFLKGFDTVLSLNYDLLVYWTMTYGLDIIDGHRFKDCFTRDGTFDDDWKRYRRCMRHNGETSNTLVFYPHGSLALCRDTVGREKKIHSDDAGLLAAIVENWRTEKCVPLFVSEGTAEQKIASIQKSYYLSTIYREVLPQTHSNLTLYGWGLGDQDRHLLRRMRSRLFFQRVSVSVFRRDQDYCYRAYRAIKHDLGDVLIEFFDSESPGCWIQPLCTDVSRGSIF